MGKPEDIPQDVWDDAWGVEAWARPHYAPASTTEEDKLNVVKAIARAILAAKAEEREACAATAEAEIVRVRERMSETSDEHRMLVSQAWGMCGDTAAIIRDAIRKRGEG